MRSDCAVVAPPSLDQDLGLSQRIEDLAVQKLVPEAGIEAFAIAVLPWRSWCDEGRLGAYRANPGAHLLGDKFRAIVGPYKRGRAAQDEQVSQSVDHVG